MSLITRTLVALGDGVARCDVAPDAGGAIAGFWWEVGGRRLDWLRPAGAAALAGAAPDGMACFPLVPWGNRIRDGQFAFAGRAVRLESGDPHALHGHGWRRAWTVVERSEAHVTLEYRHEPDSWPWAYRARQRIAIEDGCLALALEVTNLSDALMPAGLGFHPYFPWTPALTLEAETRGVWLTDDERLPRAHVAPHEARALVPGLDDIFTGWDGHARLDWPERGCRLSLAASWPLMSFLAVFVPDARDYLCVEPMSHCADAINIARQGGAETGLRVLAPGATRSAQMRLAPAMGEA